jgi:hypothetical protein
MLQVKLKHRLSAQLRNEKLREVEFKKRLKTEREVHFCEPEQGSILGEGDGEDVEERHVESLMDCVESSEQHEDLMMSEASNETIGSYVFQTDNLCMIAGLVDNGQSFEVVTEMKEDETTLSHKGKMETHT